MSDYLIEINKCPNDLRRQYTTLFTEGALMFLAELFVTFDLRINQLYHDRSVSKYKYKISNDLPKFIDSKHRNDKTWKVKPVTKRLVNRHLDLGDVSPSNTIHFFQALTADVQGIQVDFDDGHCPTWRNQIVGLYNVYRVVHQEDIQIKSLSELPILMLRPRAWNMVEHNVIVNGKKLPGALVDYSILMYHNAYTLYTEDCGPCFYLSKLESSKEAKLWNDIFIWSQEKLNIPYGTIKACVLIENILSSFEMEEILYELKDHSLGLNCGIWDYSASIITKFGHRKDFILPDRNKYVNTQKHFLKKYMQLVVQICHARGAHATGGMAAQLVNSKNSQEAIEQVIANKRFEIEIGVDGFMVYDIKLVAHMNQLWVTMSGNNLHQISFIPDHVITATDLLMIPSGGVTKNGLIHNIEVSILFVYNWLQGNGHFVNKSTIEDSATAEISRLQIWQWIIHKAKLEENGEVITFGLIHRLTENYLNSATNTNKKLLIVSTNIFLDVVSAAESPEFLTTYLNDHYMYRKIHQLLPISNTIMHKL